MDQSDDQVHARHNPTGCVTAARERCFSVLHKLAQPTHGDPSFDRWRFMLTTYEIFGEPIEPVTGPDPRS